MILTGRIICKFLFLPAATSFGTTYTLQFNLFYFIFFFFLLKIIVFVIIREAPETKFVLVYHDLIARMKNRKTFSKAKLSIILKPPAPLPSPPPQKKSFQSEALIQMRSIEVNHSNSPIIVQLSNLPFLPDVRTLADSLG